MVTEALAIGFGESPGEHTGGDQAESKGGEAGFACRVFSSSHHRSILRSCFGSGGADGGCEAGRTGGAGGGAVHDLYSAGVPQELSWAAPRDFLVDAVGTGTIGAVDPPPANSKNPQDSWVDAHADGSGQQELKGKRRAIGPDLPSMGNG